MLGSFQDAEDALQDTLLAAWQHLDRFGERASIRTWLYRIAANRCLNLLRSVSRRAAKEWDIPGVEPPEPNGYSEIVWLEPYPDALLKGAIEAPPGPEARYEQICASMIGQGRTYHFVSTRANGQPAFGAYLRDPNGIRRGTGLIVLTLSGDRICATTRFESSVLPWFWLPRSLPD